MANEWSFPIFKEQTDGSVILDKDVDVSALILLKDAVVVSPPAIFVNNGDGNYIVDYTAYGSGSYSVQFNGSTQSELDNKYLVADDNITTQDIRGTTVKGDIEKDGSGKLVLKNGSDVLHGTDVVDSVSSTVTDVPASPNSVKIAYDLAAAAEVSDSTILKEADLNSEIATGGATKGVNADLLKTHLDMSQISDETYLSISKNNRQNLELLQAAIKAITAGGLVSYQTIFSDFTNITGSFVSALAVPQHDIDNGQTYILFRAVFYKRSYHKKLHFSCFSSSDDAGQNIYFDLMRDGSVTNTDNNQDQAPLVSTQFDYNWSITGWANDTLYEVAVQIRTSAGGSLYPTSKLFLEAEIQS